MFRRFLKRIFTPPFVVLAALFMFVEEWIWDRLTALMARVGRLPVIRGIEHWMGKLPPYGALVILALPGLLLLPVKLAALYFMAHGHAGAGLAVIVLAKLIGTALVARMFSVCQPSLMAIGWLRRLTEWLKRVKAYLYGKIQSMVAWQYATRVKQRIAAWFRRFRGDGLRRRWRAIRYRLRGRKQKSVAGEFSEAPKELE